MTIFFWKLVAKDIKKHNMEQTMNLFSLFKIKQKHRDKLGLLTKLLLKLINLTKI